MCRILSISESGYYSWLRPLESERSVEDKALTRRIKELYAEHKGKAGAPPMITADIRKETRFLHVGKNRIARIMKENGLRCKYARKYKTTTDSRHCLPVADNLLNRNFTVPEPDKVWVGDITY